MIGLDEATCQVTRVVAGSNFGLWEQMQRTRRTSRRTAAGRGFARGRTGAKPWTADLRLFYANDPLVLLAVDGHTNNAKGDSDTAEWLPTESFRCRYVARQIAIKTKYDLWATQPERMAMSDILGAC
jgi:hypothetical protein